MRKSFIILQMLEKNITVTHIQIDTAPRWADITPPCLKKMNMEPETMRAIIVQVC